MSRGDFVFEIGQHIDFNFLHATITNRYRLNGRKFYQYQCDKCNCVNEKPEHLVEKGSGCPVCAGRKVVKGINDITTTDPWMIKFFPGGEDEASKFTYNSSQKFTPICPHCKRIKDTQDTPNNIYNHKKVSCICNDGVSIPNKFIYGLCEQLKEQKIICSFKREFHIRDNKGVQRKFDMFIEDNKHNNYVIEMDGGLNHGNVIKKHRNLKFMPAKLFYADIVKDDIAERENYTIIRVDCFKSEFDYIKEQLLLSDFPIYFNLDNIDWVRICDLCYGNLVKDVCDYKNMGDNIFCSDAAKKFGLSTTTIRKYWRIGNELGLCHYIPGEDKYISDHKPKIFNRCTPIEVTNLITKESFIHESRADFVRNCQQLYGIDLTLRQIEKRLKKNNPYNYENKYLIYKTK